MQKGKIIYIYDAMCGWCYAFSPVIKQIKEEYGDKIPFEVWSGGMVLGDQIQPISAIADYIKGAYKRVENMTGVKFGQPFLDILEEGTYTSSSELPSLALTVFKELNPKKAIDFAHDIQHAFYLEGKDLNKIETYLDLASKYDIDKERFSYYFQNGDMLNKTNEDFQNTASLGVKGFPTVIYDTGGEQIFALSRGYVDHETMTSYMDRVLEMEKDKQVVSE